MASVAPCGPEVALIRNVDGEGQLPALVGVLKDIDQPLDHRGDPAGAAAGALDGGDTRPGEFEVDGAPDRGHGAVHALGDLFGYRLSEARHKYDGPLSQVGLDEREYRNHRTPGQLLLTVRRSID